MLMHATFKGQVQGVGFRRHIAQLAERFSVGGRVRNLPDGRVKLLASGPRETLKQFFNAIQHSPGFASIEHADLSFREGDEYQDFQIMSG